MKREEIFEYVNKQYGSIPEYLWRSSPESAILRHKNGKWYAAIMRVEKFKLGLKEDGMVEIINVKCEPDMVGLLTQTYGFLPGYHMNKKYWITIIAELIVGFPGFHFSLILQAVLQITAANFFLYLAVLPIIIITSRKSGSFLIGVIVAFVYGYGGMFAAGNMTLANIYPITASLGMIHYRSYDAAVSWNLVTCTVSLAIVVAISAGLILCMKEKEPKQVKKKAKKVAPKKGW